ncbi:chromate transporter [Caryophanon tenue]|nr:chromate transporter [Caryophanon tenue]
MINKQQSNTEELIQEATEQQSVTKSRGQVHKELAMGFFRAGILGFGGGPTAIPLMKKEVVDNYGFMDSDEFAKQIAIGNTLPGPIATKLAGSIGFQVAGWLGMLNAIFASMLPSAILMIVLLGTLAKYREVGWVNGMTNGVVPIVGVMMAVLTWEFFTKANKQLGLKLAIPLLIASIVAMEVLGIHPGIVIAILLFLAFALPVKGAKA